jgi:HK97 gp10 family phage protein
MASAGTINFSAADKMLGNLPKRIDEEKIVTKALRKGAEVIREAAHGKLVANGTVETGIMAGTLQIARRDSGQPGVVEVVVKPSSKLSTVIRPSRWGKDAVRYRPSKVAHWIEFGTEHAPAAPFMRPAADEKRSAAEEAIRAEMTAGVAKLK